MAHCTTSNSFLKNLSVNNLLISSISTSSFEQSIGSSFHKDSDMGINHLSKIMHLFRNVTHPTMHNDNKYQINSSAPYYHLL